MFFLIFRRVPLFLLGALFSICAMDDALNKSSSSSTSSTSQPKQLPMSFRSVGGVLNTPQLETPPKQLKDDDIFEGVMVSDLKTVFAQAPEDAQDIVDILQNPGNLQAGTYRYAFFVGVPGTGKTRTAKAIAYKMMIAANWAYKFMNATDIVAGTRNQAAEMLRGILHGIITSNKPTIFIIDELNKILENSDSKNHDTDTTSAMLWSFLDGQNYKKFFFIGLMNRYDKLPEALKSRVMLRVITFGEIKELDKKVAAFTGKLTEMKAYLDPSIKQTELSQLLDSNPTLSGRDFHEIAFRVSKVSWRENKSQENFLVTMTHLKRVFDELSKSRTASRYGIVEETSDERQERHHEANIDLQKQGLEMQKNHFNKQQAQQEVQQSSNQAVQEKHFVMQYKLQKKAHNTQEFNYVQQLVIQDKLNKKKLTIQDLLSDEQRAIYDCLISQGMDESIRSCDEYMYEDEIKELRAKRKKANELFKEDRNEVWANMEKEENEKKKKANEEAAKKASSSSSSSSSSSGWFWS